MKIAVLGAICFDEIYDVDGNKTESFGGISYNIAALSSIAATGETIVPVTKIGRDRHAPVMEMLARFSHLDTRAISVCDSPLTHVTLRWTSRDARQETILHKMPPFDAHDLLAANDADVAHFNFINGTELSLERLKQFRADYKDLISVDVHQLISHFSEDGKRTLVGFSNWAEWMPHIDIVQCNELELQHTVGRTLTTRADFLAAAKSLCSAGARIVAVTLGGEGALMVYQDGETMRAVEAKPFQPENAIETTGCGDSFSAGFLMGLVRHGDPLVAFASAIVVAGANAQRLGIGNLTDVSAQLREPLRHVRVVDVS